MLYVTYHTSHVMHYIFYLTYDISYIVCEACAWTPNNVLGALMVVESLLFNFKWKSKHSFVRSAEFLFVWSLGLGT